MTFLKIKTILDDLEKSGCLKLTLTGGEPTLREDFPEILSCCIQKGFATTLFTNATHFTPQVKEAIRERPPFAVECSLYGASARVHDAITRAEGSFALAFENLKWMTARGIRVIVKSVTLSLNLQEIEAIEEACKRLGVIHQPTFRVFPSLNPARSPERLRIKPKEIKALLRMRMKLPSSPDPPRGEWICNAGREACSISADGKVYPCVVLRWECGDLKRTPFRDIWSRSPVLEKIRSYQEEAFLDCFRCKRRAACHFCPGMGFLEHGDLLRPSKELCRLTRAVSPGRP